MHCSHGPNKANFFGVMVYDRTWFDHDLYAVTLGGGFMNNPGRYLALLPPINGATAVSGTPTSPRIPGRSSTSGTRSSISSTCRRTGSPGGRRPPSGTRDVPYWSGAGGVTPPTGQQRRAPASFVCNNGSADGADICANEGGVWYPDLRTREVVWGAGVMVKF